MYRGLETQSITLLQSVCLLFLWCLCGSAAVSMETGQVVQHANPNSVLWEKQVYLDRVRSLYDSLTRRYNTTGDPDEFIRRLSLKGIVADLLSAEDSPVSTLMPYRRGNWVLQEESNGRFKSIVTVDPPTFDGERCFLVQGTVDYDTLSGHLTGVSPVSCSERAGTRTKVLLSEERRVGGSVDHYTNGSDGINELLSLSKKVECKRNLEGECERGTVVMDDWMNKTLAFQRRLAENVSLSQQQIIGSHNSFNDRAEGYGDIDGILNEVLKLVSDDHWEFVWAQQYFTMTDQLDMGVRYLMLDPVYFWGAMRLCHCGTTFKWVDKLIDYLEKVLHTKFQFDSGDLGCLPDDRKFEDGVKEIRDWLTAPGHESEVLIINVNDFSKDHDWGHIPLIQDPIKDLFGEMIFSPNDKQKYYPNRWPTSKELIALGKRVIVIGSDRCANASLIFVDMTVPGWDKDTTKYFTPYPECGGYRPGQWYTVGGESQLIGPIYNGPAEEGLITTENMPYLLQCPVTVLKVDLVSPGLLDSAVWSWAKGYSVDNLTSQCPAMNISDSGRWVTLPCSTQLLHACKSGSDITLSNTPGPWNSTDCPQGYTSYLPPTGYDNWQLYQYIIQGSSQVSYVWLNL